MEKVYVRLRYDISCILFNQIHQGFGESLNTPRCCMNTLKESLKSRGST